MLGGIDFHDTLMHGMLSFLLFAERPARGPVRAAPPVPHDRAELATAGTLVSALVIGAATWLLAGWAGHPIPFVWALVFGALISPTRSRRGAGPVQDRPGAALAEGDAGR